MIRFNNFILEINEAFDSSFPIYKREKEGNVSLLYFNVGEKPYRIFIEEEKVNGVLGLHLGFQRKMDDDWIMYGETKDLSTKEVLSLFGTLYKSLEGKTFNILYISTPEIRKFNSYHKLINKLNDKIKAQVVENNNWIYLISDNNITIPKSLESKFKWK